MEREVGGGIGMGNTCKPMAVLLQCMTKFTTNKKKKKTKKKKRKVVYHEKQIFIHLSGYKKNIRIIITYFISNVIRLTR